METLLVAARFVQFLSAAILLGASLFPSYAIPAAERILRDDVAIFVQKVVLIATLAMLFSAIMWFICETVLMSGDANGYRNGATTLAVLNDTQFGRIWRWRLVLLTGLSIFYGWRVLSSRKPVLWPAHLSGILLTASLAGVGHEAAYTGYDAVLHEGNQALHMLAAAVWIGGLLSLYVTIRLLARSGRGVLIQVLGRFSTVAFAAVLIILASGSLNSWFLVASLRALLHTPYGQVLMIKVSLVLCMIACALFNRLYAMPRLARNASEILPLLLRSIAVEQIIAVLVVASVSVLGTLPPAMDMPGMPM